MPRFHFQASQLEYGRDDEGTELPDLAAARLAAIEFAGRLIAEDSESVVTGEPWHMEVTDHIGLLLFRLDFVVAASPLAEQALLAASRPMALRTVPSTL